MIQHKPVVFVVRMQKKKQTKTVGRRTVEWWRCKDDVAVEYDERVTVKYEELIEEVDGVEEEWKKVTKKHFWELQRSYVEEHRDYKHDS